MFRSWHCRQQEPRDHRQVIGDAQGVVLPDLGFDPFDPWAVEQVVDGAVGAVEAGVVRVVGQPVLAVDAAGLVVGGDHWVFVPQQVQRAVSGVGRALFGWQAQVLAEGEEVEVAADQPGRAC